MKGNRTYPEVGVGYTFLSQHHHLSAALCIVTKERFLSVVGWYTKFSSYLDVEGVLLDVKGVLDIEVLGFLKESL